MGPRHIKVHPGMTTDALHKGVLRLTTRSNPRPSLLQKLRLNRVPEKESQDTTAFAISPKEQQTTEAN